MENDKEKKAYNLLRLPSICFSCLSFLMLLILWLVSAGRDWANYEITKRREAFNVDKLKAPSVSAIKCFRYCFVLFFVTFSFLFLFLVSFYFEKNCLGYFFPRLCLGSFFNVDVDWNCGLLRFPVALRHNRTISGLLNDRGSAARTLHENPN